MRWLLGNTKPSTLETTDDTPVPVSVDVQPDAGTNFEDPTEQPQVNEHDAWLLALKRRLHQQVVSSMDPTSLGSMSDEQLRHAIREEVIEFCQRPRPTLP